MWPVMATTSGDSAGWPDRAVPLTVVAQTE